ncbi:Chaperone protein DnaK [Planctomycetaceae bacterium]|nr:Chaperone protein DnaK [Planctomycetaceae bacterium]
MRLKVNTTGSSYEHTVPAGKSSLVVGSRASDDLRIDDHSVSGPHVRLEKMFNAWSFTDQMSDAGTFHNGEKKPTGELAVGDVLTLGAAKIEILSLDDAPAAPVAAPQATRDLAEELYAAMRDAGEDQGTFSYQRRAQRDATYRELAKRALDKGPRERVEFMLLPLLREGIKDLYEIEADIKADIDDPLEDLSPEELQVIDFVAAEFKARHRINLRDDRFAMERVAFDAEFVVEDLKDEGKAELLLPYLAAAPDGPRHFCVNIVQEGARMVVKDWLEHTPKPAEFKPRPPDAQEILLDLVTAKFKAETDVDLWADNAAMTRLRDAVKKACIELKSTQETRIDLPFITAEKIEPTHLNMRVTREMLGAAGVIEDKPAANPEPTAEQNNLGQQVLQWILAIVIIALILIAMYVLDL